MLPIRRRRMLLSFWVIMLAFGIILAHLYQIQLQGYKYARQAFQMGAQGLSLEQFTRGEITDRQGLSLTGGYYANRVAVIPALMDEKDLRLQQLAAILNVDVEQLQARAQQGAFYIDRTFTGNTHAALQNAALPGVYLLPVYRRYGNEPLAVHITGHIGKISSREQFEQLQSTGKAYLLGDWVGQSGLEYFYEQQLKGTLAKRWARVPVDARGRIIQGPGLLVESSDSDPGRLNVITTIDGRMQRIVEDIMNEHIDTGAVVVMQAGSGDILAMASRPGYHPEYYQAVSNIDDEKTGELFVDHCTALFQPGSVFKVVLAAAALEEGLVQASSVFNCAGAAAQPVRCWNDAGHGRISFQQAFTQSCNPAFVEIGHRLGADTVIKYAAAFGLDKQKIIGYPVPADARQDLSLIAEPYNLANSSVGQGPVLVTPVQVTAMINAIASGGNYYTPRLVAGLSDDSGRLVRQFSADRPEPVVSSATATQLQILLREVTESGVGQKAALPDVSSAGKTGSAQVSGYNDEKVDAWFTGYIPADNPRYVITVLVRGGKSGGDTAAPVFREIAARSMELGTGPGVE